MTSSEPDPTSADLTFADLQIHPSVLQAVVDVGYESPSAIQAATIPAMLAGSDVVGLAQTGTGKTAAFAIPILSKIDSVEQVHPGVGAGAHPRAGVAGRRGVQPLRRAPAGDQGPADLRRLVLRRATGGAAARRAGRGRNAGPGDRSPRARDPRPVRARLPGARRGRRDAADGLRRGRRAHSRRHPRVQAGGVVLRHDAARHPQDHQEVPARRR